MRYRFIIIILAALFINIPVYADKHAAKEVLDIIKEVETRFNDLREEGAEYYADKEILKIEDYIISAKKRLSDGERDWAYFEINKAKAYFKLIDAKREKFEAEMELNNAQTNK